MSTVTSPVDARGPAELVLQLAAFGVLVVCGAAGYDVDVQRFSDTSVQHPAAVSSTTLPP